MATVLVVPGFGGNTLRHRWPTLDGWRTAWLEPAVLLASGLEILALDGQGIGPRIPFFPSLQASTGIPLYYPALVEYLRERGYDVDFARSDWRKPIAFSAGDLATQIMDLGRAEPVRVVAHSRGGLLAVAALQQLAARGGLGSLRQLVTLCSPHQGTYAPVPWLGGWQFTVPAAAVLLTVPGVLASGLLLRQVRSVFATFPGAYELLPNPAAAAAAGDATAAGLYDPANWAGSGVPVNTDHLAAASARWAALPAVPLGVRIDCVVGAGRAALFGPASLRSLGVRGAVPGLTDGDGVVGTWSAVLPGRNAITLPVGHQEVLSDPAALAVLDGLLRT